MAVAFIEDIYLSGSSQILIYSGMSTVQISAVGGGGAGRRGGGGAGGTASRQYSILESEWGTFLTCSIGVSVASNNGTHTTVNGTLNGVAITELKGFGGARGGINAGGAGGTHSGGDTTNWPTENGDGNAGGEYDGELEVGGAGGLAATNFFQNAGELGGAGSGGLGDPTNGFIGQNGAVYVRFGV